MNDLEEEYIIAKDKFADEREDFYAQLEDCVKVLPATITMITEKSVLEAVKKQVKSKKYK